MAKDDELMSRDADLQEQVDALRDDTPVEVSVDCAAGESLQDAIDAATPRTTILVSGPCNENIRVPATKTALIIDGQGSASINADSESAAITVRGRDITIRNFNGASITGGSTGIFVSRTGFAVIDNNTIQGAVTAGVIVNRGAFASILNNVIQDHGTNGILVSEAASARIGFLRSPDTVHPNTIQNNGSNGILLVRNAEARIMGNTISGNGSSGIALFDSSMGDIPIVSVLWLQTSFPKVAPRPSDLHGSEWANRSYGYVLEDEAMTERKVRCHKAKKADRIRGNHTSSKLRARRPNLRRFDK